MQENALLKSIIKKISEVKARFPIDHVLKSLLNIAYKN